MPDPFNTSTEAALWDERSDLDPFMAEHYAANAQHELDRALSASPPDQQRISHVRRLLGSHHALAALAQLPEESDFEETEAEATVESEGVASIHPDRLALMGSGGDESIILDTSTRGRSAVNNRRNSFEVVDCKKRNERTERLIDDQGVGCR